MSSSWSFANFMRRFGLVLDLGSSSVIGKWQVEMAINSPCNCTDAAIALLDVLCSNAHTEVKGSAITEKSIETWLNPQT